jgi:hypothetical protein
MPWRRKNILSFFQPKVELNGYLWELFVKKQGMPSSRNLLSAYSCLTGIGTPRKRRVNLRLS